MSDQFLISSILNQKPSHSVEFLVAIPPSANSIWRSFKGRVIKSKAYQVWQEAAQISLGRLGLVQSPVSVEIKIHMGKGWRSNRDLDNVAKPIIDLLKSLNIIKEDNCQVVQEIRLRALPPAHKGDNAIASVRVFSIPMENKDGQTDRQNNPISFQKTSRANRGFKKTTGDNSQQT